MSEEQSDGFVRALTRCQDRLYVYIRTLLPSVEAAQEVLQETNVVLLRKQAEMKPGQNFEAFACRVAYYEVLSYMRDRARDRHRFDESLLELLAANAAQTSDKAAARLDALQECLRRLDDRQRWLVATRYKSDGSVKEIAAQLGQPARTVATKLFRIRRALSDCIRQKMVAEGRK